VTVTPSCSISLHPVNSLTQVKGGYTAGMIVVLILIMVIMVLYGQKNHLMVIDSVYHGQMDVPTRFLLKVGRTC
jgi:hypothetical protein